MSWWASRPTAPDGGRWPSGRGANYGLPFPVRVKLDTRFPVIAEHLPVLPSDYSRGLVLQPHKRLIDHRLRFGNFAFFDQLNEIVYRAHGLSYIVSGSQIQGKQAKNTGSERRAREIRLRAERKAGSLLANIRLALVR